MGHGELYVMTFGMLSMFVLCANNLVTMEVPQLHTSTMAEDMVNNYFYEKHLILLLLGTLSNYKLEMLAMLYLIH